MLLTCKYSLQLCHSLQISPAEMIPSTLSALRTCICHGGELIYALTIKPTTACNLIVEEAVRAASFPQVAQPAWSRATYMGGIHVYDRTTGDVPSHQDIQPRTQHPNASSSQDDHQPHPHRVQHEGKQSMQAPLGAHDALAFAFCSLLS